jgi:rRNA maturation endonuclease Nob1
MNEKQYWIVKRGMRWALITCPMCFEWYNVPNTPNEVELYHFCPYCGTPLFVKKEEQFREK